MFAENDYSGLRVGYAPNNPSLDAPGDRRRFVSYARYRNIDFELADPRREYDIVYLSPRADIVSWSRYEGNARIVYELIDSYLATTRSSLRARLRGLAKFASGETRRPVVSYHSAIEAMATRADAVVCSTLEQKADLERFCDNVHVVLDFHEELGETTKSSYEAGDSFDLVWEGLPENLQGFRAMGSALERLALQKPVVLHLITSLTTPRYLGKIGHRPTDRIARRIYPKMVLHEWNLQLLPTIATSCDLALIPLDLKDPLARGKPENKLLSFWRMGLPTLTSATPAYRRVMEGAGLDMTCLDPEEWFDRLTRYSTDETARKEAAIQGRAYVREHHSADELIARWDRVFASVLSR